MTPEASNFKAFEKKLAALEKKTFIPEHLLKLVREVSLRQLEAVEQARIVEPEAQRLSSADEVMQGKPLLNREGFPVDLEQATALFTEFAALAQDIPPMDKAIEVIRRELAEGTLSLNDSFKAFLSGDDRLLEAFGLEKTPDSPRCLNFLVQSSLTPGLMKSAALLAPHLPSSINDRMHGHCPLCGSLPLIGRLKDAEGIRMLTCSFCRHEYRMPRLSCAFCGEQKSDRHEYFDSEDEPGVMVELCRNCKGYIKTLDFRKLDMVCIPVLDDLGFLPFDILARKKGYSRPSLSAWGF
jgi:FdhE protein